MDVRVAFALVYIFLGLIYKCTGQLSAQALFNSRGVKGRITFTEVSGTNNIQIEASLEGLRGNNAWHVHTLPVDQTADPSYQCLSTMAGPHFDPFNANNDSNYKSRCVASDLSCEVGDLAGKFGPIPTSGMLMVTDMTELLALSGRYSIVGRALVIHRHDDGSNFECGTIRYADETPDNVLSLQARFVSPVAGTVYLRQVRGRNTAIWGKFYWVNDMPTTINHNWHIHENAPGEEYRVGNCSVVGPHFDPENRGPTSSPGYSMNCTPSSPEGCEVGDLTGKHNTVDVSANPSPFVTDSFFYTDTTVNLMSVVNRSIAIHVPNRLGPILTCAPLVRSEDLVLYSYDNGVLNRDLRVSQLSPYEDTVIVSSIQAPINVLGSALNPVANCRANEGIYSPYPLIDSSPDGVDTPDRLALGAWEERYDLTPSSVSVFDMPIHGGNNTISGKTVQQISGDDNRVCSALLPNFEGEVILAKASFNGPIRGSIYFVQEDFGFGHLGNTLVIVDIRYSLPGMRTSGHNWHVHENRTQANTACVDAIGPHFNPFSVSLANTNDAEMPSQFSNYSDACNLRYNLRCESGDLSGKHGRLTITSEEAARPVVSFVDSNLALTGSYTVIGRSIGLHEATSDAPLFDCGDINRVYLSSAVVSARIDADRMLRSEITKMLTEGTGVDPTDVLVLSQSISPLGFGFNCVTVSSRVLGSTQAIADMNADLLRERAILLPCNGSPITVTPLSAMLLVVCLLLGLGQ